MGWGKWGGLKRLREWDIQRAAGYGWLGRVKICLRERDIQSISWLGVGAVGVSPMWLRERDIRKAEGKWGRSKRLRE
ncbi:MAG: hypothetical protein ACOXZ0_05405 [Eubacteriales bacterium]